MEEMGPGMMNAMERTWGSERRRPSVGEAGWMEERLGWFPRGPRSLGMEDSKSSETMSW